MPPTARPGSNWAPASNGPAGETPYRERPLTPPLPAVAGDGGDASIVCASASSVQSTSSGMWVGRFSSLTGGPSVADRVLGALPSLPSAFRRGSRNSSRKPSEFRIRFFNFNMANNPSLNSLDDIHGPGGRGRFEAVLREPFGDGHPVDIVHTTLVETRLNLSAWVEEYLGTHRGQRLDSLLVQNARREGSMNTRSKLRSIAEGIAASYNGNLKTMLGFSSKAVKEDECVIFGRLTEAKVAGIAVPNPKKAFMGKAVSDPATGIRLCFVGAHFPIASVAAAIEDPNKDALNEAKVQHARTLRRVIRKAASRGIIDWSTILFVQGDLNSRTVIQNGQVRDVLLELLKDDVMQAAIINELPVPPGRWYEMVPNLDVSQLQVTYKFCDNSGGAEGGLTLGKVLEHCQHAISSDRITHTQSSLDMMVDDEGGRQRRIRVQPYKRMLAAIPPEVVEGWGVQAMKKSEFRPFRFPASADRVIYWAPDVLAPRLEWRLPRGGYEVNYNQMGSDHRPVAVEALLVINSPGRVSSRSPSTARTEGGSVGTSSIDMASCDAWSRRNVQLIMDMGDGGEDSDGEAPEDVTPGPGDTDSSQGVAEVGDIDALSAAMPDVEPRRKPGLDTADQRHQHRFCV